MTDAEYQKFWQDFARRNKIPRGYAWVADLETFEFKVGEKLTGLVNPYKISKSNQHERTT